MSGFYSTSTWARIRARQLAREPMCESCGAPAQHVDHRRRISEGGAKRDGRNLQSLCDRCHNSKSAAEKAGRAWTPLNLRGCDEHGMPVDPAHPWNAERELQRAPFDDGDPHLLDGVQEPGGVRSLRLAPPDRRATRKRI